MDIPSEDFQGLKLYLAGPMRGLPYFNFPEFDRVTAALRAKGHFVFNPAERDRIHYGNDVANAAGSEEQAIKTHCFDLRCALHDDLAFICAEADGIVLLPGWQRSMGALAEHAVARALRLQVFVPEQLI
jgi:Domain of unknown function (DUF4406)